MRKEPAGQKPPVCSKLILSRCRDDEHRSHLWDASCEARSTIGRCDRPTSSPMHRSRTSQSDPAPQPPRRRQPEQMPDPWLFDTVALLRELDRCRELILLIPATTHAVHFAANNALDCVWNLQQNVRYLYHLHCEGQRAFARKAEELNRKSAPKITSKVASRTSKTARRAKQVSLEAESLTLTLPRAGVT